MNVDLSSISISERYSNLLELCSTDRGCLSIKEVVFLFS